MATPQQLLQLRAMAHSVMQIPDNSYRFLAKRELECGAVVGGLIYGNPWLRIEYAIRVAPDWYLTLEHSRLGAWVLGGFHDWHHYQFRALQGGEEVKGRASLFLDWALQIKARYFSPIPTII